MLNNNIKKIYEWKPRRNERKKSCENFIVKQATNRKKREMNGKEEKQKLMYGLNALWDACTCVHLHFYVCICASKWNACCKHALQLDYQIYQPFYKLYVLYRKFSPNRSKRNETKRSEMNEKIDVTQTVIIL